MKYSTAFFLLHLFGIQMAFSQVKIDTYNNKVSCFSGETGQWTEQGYSCSDHKVAIVPFGNGYSLRDKQLKEWKQKVKVDLAKGANKVQVSVLNQAGAESYKETFEIECSVGKAKPDFTYCLFNGIESKEADSNEDAEIWLSELHAYLSSKVLELSSGQQKLTSRIENQTMDYRVW